MDIPPAEEAWAQRRDGQFNNLIDTIKHQTKWGLGSSSYPYLRGNDPEDARALYDRAFRELTPLGYAVKIETMKDGAITSIRISWHPEDVKAVREEEKK